MNTRSFLLFAGLSAFALLACAAPAAAEDDEAVKGSSHEGLVVSTGDHKLTMTDKAGKNEHTHEVATNAKITCDGKECKLEDLKAGDAIKVTTKKQGDKTVAVRIDAAKGAKK
jgi:hypothetical protein